MKNKKYLTNIDNKHSLKTSLLSACKEKNISLDTIKNLIENKAEVNDSYYLESPVYNVLHRYEIPLDTLKFLLENNAQISEPKAKNYNRSVFFQALNHKKYGFNSKNDNGLNHKVIKCIFENAHDLYFSNIIIPTKLNHGLWWDKKETNNIYKGLFISFLEDFKTQISLPFLLSLKVLETSPKLKIPKVIKYMIIKFTDPVEFIFEKFQSKFTSEKDSENLSKALLSLEHDNTHVIEELLFNNSDSKTDEALGKFVYCCLSGKTSDDEPSQDHN